MTVNKSKQHLLRRLQEVETEMLKDVANVCDKYNLEYYLSSGTLLGAVRHKGFIPWDDDIDIDMPIEDYRKFIEIAQNELGDKYFVQNSMTEPNFNFGFTKIRKNNTTMLTPYDKSYRIHHGIWIDVFPLVAVQPGVSLKIQKTIIKISNFIQIQNKIESHKAEFEHSLGPVGMFIMNSLSKLPMTTRQKIHNRLLNTAFGLNPNKCTHRANVWGNITSIIPKEVYNGESKKIPFETEMFNAPNGYIQYLETKFGDYMTLPPVSERHGHGDDMIIDFDNSYEKYMDYKEQ